MTDHRAPLEDLRRWADYETAEHSSKDATDEELIELADGNYTCYVVPHTHWDKEWGFSFEQHRQRLVKLIDNTVGMLENDPEYRCFVLDGQSSLVEDYLALRPEMKPRIEALVKADRLLVGPWYTALDMFVSSGEEIVRNLAIGIRTAREVGGEMRWGHSADNFGYCSQLPQIYRGCGIGRASLYRGPEPGGSEYRTVFRWRALDGESEVYVANFTGGAGYLQFTWPFDVPEMAEHFTIKTLRNVAPNRVTDRLLFPAGTDAAEPDPATPRVLKRLEKSFPGFTFKIASFDEYLDDVLSDRPQLPVHTGTLRHPARSCVGCISARLNHKRDNAKAYTNLEAFAEPYSALAWLVRGRRYPSGSIEHAWKMLLENLSHDNMAGYSYDEVYLLGDARYYESNRLAETLAIRGMKTIIEDIRTPDGPTDVNRSLVVFNPLAWQRTDVVDTAIPLQPQRGIPSAFLDGGYASVKVVDLCGKEMAATPVREGNVIRLQFVAEDVPPMGYKTFRLLASNDEPHEYGPERSVDVIENESIKLTFAGDATFTILDKETGAEFPGLGYFEDQTARGNPLGYRWEGKPRTTHGLNAEVMLVEDGPAVTTVRVRWDGWRVPSNRGDDAEVPMPITSYVSLSPGVKRVDVFTEIENAAHFHFLRAGFPVPVKVDTFAAGEQFGMQELPVWDPENPPGKAWTEEIYPHQDWADISDGETGLAIMARGTPVISVYPDRNGVKVMLPMFRSAGSNTADARWSLPDNRFSSAPRATGAQLEGTQRVHYSIMPHAGDWRDAKIYQEGASAATRLWPEEIHLGDRNKFQLGVYGFPAVHEEPEGTMPPEQSFLRIEPEGVVLSAFKKAETGEGIVFRIYSTLPAARDVTATFFREALGVAPVNMLEDQRADAPHVDWEIDGDGRTVMRFSLRPFQIATIRMTLEAPPEGRWWHTTY